MTQLPVFPGRIIFDHLPKTAGQAVNAWLAKELGTGCVTENLIGPHRELIRRYGGCFSVISAHVEFEGMGLDPRYSYITCIREPLDRAISWLFFVVKNHEQQDLPDLWKAAERFLASDGDDLDPLLVKSISNPYVKHFAEAIHASERCDEDLIPDALTVLEQYSAWGFFEDLPEFIQDVASLIGVPAPASLNRVNVTRTRPSVEQISPKLRARLEQLNALDLAFYRECQERSARRRVHKLIDTRPDVSRWQPYNAPTGRRFVTPDFNLNGIALAGGKNNVSRGEILEFCLEFSLAKPIDELEVGIHIFDVYGRWAFGINTTLMARRILNAVPGTHRATYYVVADLPEGDYTAGFAVSEIRPHGKRDLAWYDSLVHFRVSGSKLGSGVGYADVPVEFAYKHVSDRVVTPLKDGRGIATIQGDFGDLTTGETITTCVSVHNHSDETWVSTAVSPLMLTYQWLDETGSTFVGERERTPFPAHEIKAGEAMSMQMCIKAPTVPGRFRLVLCPRQEGQQDFDELGFSVTETEFAVLAPGYARNYLGSDPRLLSQVGKRELGGLSTTGIEGFLLLFGPYAAFRAGKYLVRIEGGIEAESPGNWVDVGCEQGSRTLAFVEIDGPRAGALAELAFELADAVGDLEVRVWVSAETRARVESLHIMPISEDIQEQGATVESADHRN